MSRTEVFIEAHRSECKDGSWSLRDWSTESVRYTLAETGVESFRAEVAFELLIRACMRWPEQTPTPELPELAEQAWIAAGLDKTFPTEGRARFCQRLASMTIAEVILCAMTAAHDRAEAVYGSRAAWAEQMASEERVWGSTWNKGE